MGDEWMLLLVTMPLTDRTFSNALENSSQSTCPPAESYDHTNTCPDLEYPLEDNVIVS